jgi:hypothetical protein
MRTSKHWALLLAAAGTILAYPLAAQDNGQAQRTEDLSSLATLEGICVELVVSDDDVTGRCNGVMLRTVYKDGRLGFMFVAHDIATATFTGEHGPELGDDKTIHLDRVILATFKDNKPVPFTFPANGTCVSTDPDFGPAKITCRANTDHGLFSGSFVSNGKPPKIERFQ